MALPAVAMGIGALIGGIQALDASGDIKRANRDLKKLFSQRKAFQTPQEVFDILNMSQYNTQQGYSDETLKYLSDNAGAGLAAGLGTATRLGADPNQLSALIDNYYGNIFKVGAENEMVKMRKFNDLTNALQLVAQNDEAEQVSRDNLIKDQMAAAAQRLAKGEQNLSSGLNFAVGSLVAGASNNIYKTQNPTSTPVAGVNTAPYTVTTVPASAPLDMSVGTIPAVPNRPGVIIR